MAQNTPLPTACRSYQGLLTYIVDVTQHHHQYKHTQTAHLPTPSSSLVVCQPWQHRTHISDTPAANSSAHACSITRPLKGNTPSSFPPHLAEAKTAKKHFCVLFLLLVQCVAGKNHTTIDSFVRQLSSDHAGSNAGQEKQPQHSQVIRTHHRQLRESRLQPGWCR